MSERKTIKVNFFTRVMSMGDGSCCVRFFRTEEDAERDGESDDERFCEDVQPEKLEFYEDGTLVMDSAEHSKAQDEAWQARLAAEKAFKQTKGAKKRTLAKIAFDTADKKWASLL